MTDTIPVCDYEGSNYQKVFWEEGGRAYEDLAEQIALNTLLPANGDLFLEIGAGAGRQTPLLKNFERVVLMDYSRTQLAQARDRLGTSTRYTYVAADVYHLPFRPQVFSAAMMVRVMHHLVKPQTALKEIHAIIQANGTFILEFANKQNLKSMLRYLLKQQTWSPFTLEPIEFVKLNFDFHPQAMRQWLATAGFEIRAQRGVSYLRVGALKRFVSPKLLAALDGVAQPLGAMLPIAPSIFIKSAVSHPQVEVSTAESIFVCPQCKGELIELKCSSCGRQYKFENGIYDFKEPV